jgi:hypothetical protein
MKTRFAFWDDSLEKGKAKVKDKKSTKSSSQQKEWGQVLNMNNLKLH